MSSADRTFPRSLSERPAEGHGQYRGSAGRRTITIALTLVSFAIVTRYLGVEGFGAYSLVLTFLLLAVTIADLGMTPIGVRELARRRRRPSSAREPSRPARRRGGRGGPSAGRALRRRPVRATGSGGAATRGAGRDRARPSRRPDDRLPEPPASRAGDGGRGRHLGDDAHPRDRRHNGRPRVLRGAARHRGRLVFRSRDRLRPRVAAHARAVRFRRSRGAPSNEGVAPVGFFTILGIVHFRIDTVLLSILKPLADVGVYSVAYRFIEQVLYIPSFFVAAVFPIIASYHATSDALLKLAIDKSFAFLVILGFPVTARSSSSRRTSSTSSRAPTSTRRSLRYGSSCSRRSSSRTLSSRPCS